MRVERTLNPADVQAILDHPSLAADVWDMGLPKKLPASPTIYYLLVKDERHSGGSVEDLTLGAMMFVPMNPVTWNPHIAILPEYRGTGAEALRLGMAWIFENTGCRKLVGYPPAFNQRMIRVFEKCGWKREGFSPASFSWNGQLHDRLMLGIEKGYVARSFDDVTRMG